MLGVIQSFGDELPAVCQNTHQEAWTVFEPFLVKYGAEYPIFPFHSPDSNRHSKCCRSERDVDDAEQLWLGKSNVGFEHISDRYIVHTLSSKARALHVLTRGT